MGWESIGATPAGDATAALPESPWAKLGATPAPSLDAQPPRAAVGPMEHLNAGYQASATGLMLRRKLPELFVDPNTSKWWERAISGVGQIGSEFALMVPAAIVGQSVGGAIGGAVSGPAAPAGAAVGSILGSGAAAFAVPGIIRETLMHSYRMGDAKTPDDYWSLLKTAAMAGLKEGAIGAATFGAGAAVKAGAAVALGAREAAPAIGMGLATATTKGAQGVIGSAGLAGEIATMTTLPAALQGRLPTMQEVLDAAILVGGLKSAHVAARNIMDTYSRTGKTPAEQVIDAQNDPSVSTDLAREPFVPPKLDKLISEAEKLAGPKEPSVRDLIMSGVDRQDVVRDTVRINELEAKAVPVAGETAIANSLTTAEVAELNTLRNRFASVDDTRETSLNNVYTSITNDMLAAGRSREEATAIATIERERYRARAERLMVDPWELFSERPLTIRAGADGLPADGGAGTPPGATASRQAGGIPVAKPSAPEVDMFGAPMAVENLTTQEVPLANLVLSKEVPQFKKDANESGVIVPLGGSFDRTGVGPIQVWERVDGTMEVISGRHRFDLAKRSGETTIPAQIHREADGFTRAKAAVLDAELNIREEQGSVADYASYFKASGIDQAAAESRGLLARAKGRAGFAIARDASDDVVAAHRAGLLSDDAALGIATTAPADAALQAVGIKLVNEGKSILFATNMMRSVGLLNKERGTKADSGDLFGLDDSGMKDAADMAQRASRQQRTISEQIAAVSGAVKRPEVARKMGVDVKDPEAIKAKIAELRQEQYQWDNWPLYPDLVAKLREQKLNQDAAPEFSLARETPAEIKARDEEAAAQAKRKIAQDAPATRGPTVKADQADLFNTQGSLFQENRGAYTPSKNLIELFKTADKSTALHELGHSWLEEMKLDAARSNVPESIKADWETLRRELAIPESGEIGTASHEQFARSVERYVAEGRAPSPELQGVFERFSEWLLNIYRELKNLNVEISPELRDVLDRMMATDEQITAARELGVPRAYVDIAKAERASEIVPGFKAEQISIKPLSDELMYGPRNDGDIQINTKYINGPEDLKLAIQRIAEVSQPEILKARGGDVKTWDAAKAEQTRLIGQMLGGDDAALARFRARLGDELKADTVLGILKDVAIRAAEESASLRDVILKDRENATVEMQLEYMASIERSRMIQAEFLGQRASVARALNALKDLNQGGGEMVELLNRLYQSGPEMTPAERSAYAKKKLDEIMLQYSGKTVLDIAKLHKEIGSLKAHMKFADAVTKATTWEKLIEGWRAALLSGPVTHVTNLFGTGVFQAVRAPVDALAAMIGMARGAKVGAGENDRAALTEGIAHLTGYLGAIPEGVKLGYETFIAGEVSGKTESYRRAIEGTKGEIIRTSLRFMGAEDAMVNTMYYRGELKALALRQALSEGHGLMTRELAQRVDELANNPPALMDAQAKAEATRMTFNTDLGAKGVALQHFVKTWHLEWMMPFVRTPINIFKEFARMSPLAPVVSEWRSDIAKGGVARDKAIAEIAIGSATMALTMAYAFDGNVSGAGSPDPGKNKARVGVWQPYSVLIGDTWYEYQRLQPFGTLVGMAADIASVWDHLTEEEGDKVPKMLAMAFANAVTNQTFLQGITNFVNAVSDPGRFGPKLLQQFAASTVPNIIGQPTTMADPVVREIDSVLEAVQARIPGMRQELRPKLDWLGQPVETKERLGVISPVRETKISEDKVRLQAEELGISVQDAPKKIHIGKGTGKLGEVELTPEEKQNWSEVGGKMAHGILTQIVNMDGYDAMPDIIKKKIFTDVLKRSHRYAAITAIPADKRAAYMENIAQDLQEELK